MGRAQILLSGFPLTTPKAGCEPEAASGLFIFPEALGHSAYEKNMHKELRIVSGISFSIILVVREMNEGIKSQTQQMDIKELATTKTNCCIASRHLCMSQIAALEHTSKSTANSQLALSSVPA